jgi:hypothetical protein
MVDEVLGKDQAWWGYINAKENYVIEVIMAKKGTLVRRVFFVSKYRHIQ